MAEGGARGGIGRRIGWFVLLWLAGVAMLGAVAVLVRFMLGM
ncbi:MAG: DUF2474 family protein [Hyphomicrobiaceae bacterium]